MPIAPSIGWLWSAAHGSPLTASKSVLSEGETVDIGAGVAHRIENIGENNLVFIEIQRGNVLWRGRHRSAAGRFRQVGCAPSNALAKRQVDPASRRHFPHG